MALPDLTGQNIQDTYQRVLQTDNGTLRDGTGSLISSLTISNYTLPTTDGDANQTIITDGVGNLLFANPTAEATHIEVKNETSETITKGTPVYITGNVGGSTRLTIDVADASDPNKMPSVGLLESTLGPNGEGFVAQGGFLRQISTEEIDGTSTTSNDTVYVKAGGGLTVTKPSGSALIQNIAKVARSHQSAGSLIVSSILRTNDVPNLLEGQIFFGSGSNQMYQTHISSALDNTTLNNITASGDISASGTITTLNLVVTDDLTLTDDVNINATGRIYLTGAGGNEYITSPTTGIVEIAAGLKVLVSDPLHVNTNITASGNISASGDIYFNNISGGTF